ncbi:MAG TPA: hypothetical protein VGA38_06035 [Candidatus Limnocylindria bacterium]
MFSSIRAALRLLATRVGIVGEPRYIAVRVHVVPDEAARVYGDRAA